MRYIPKLYLETTVFNLYFAPKNSKKQRDTIRLFDAIKRGKYETFTSDFVLDEIAKDIPIKHLKMKV